MNKVYFEFSPKIVTNKRNEDEKKLQPAREMKMQNFEVNNEIFRMYSGVCMRSIVVNTEHRTQDSRRVKPEIKPTTNIVYLRLCIV